MIIHCYVVASILLLFAYATDAATWKKVDSTKLPDGASVTVNNSSSSNSTEGTTDDASNNETVKIVNGHRRGYRFDSVRSTGQEKAQKTNPWVRTYNKPPGTDVATVYKTGNVGADLWDSFGDPQTTLQKTDPTNSKENVKVWKSDGSGYTINKNDKSLAKDIVRNIAKPQESKQIENSGVNVPEETKGNTNLDDKGYVIWTVGKGSGSNGWKLENYGGKAQWGEVNDNTDEVSSKIELGNDSLKTDGGSANIVDGWKGNNAESSEWKINNGHSEGEPLTEGSLEETKSWKVVGDGGPDGWKVLDDHGDVEWTIEYDDGEWKVISTDEYKDGTWQIPGQDISRIVEQPETGNESDQSKGTSVNKNENTVWKNDGGNTDDYANYYENPEYYTWPETNDGRWTSSNEGAWPPVTNVAVPEPWSNVKSYEDTKAANNSWSKLADVPEKAVDSVAAKKFNKDFKGTEIIATSEIKVGDGNSKGSEKKSGKEISSNTESRNLDKASHGGNVGKSGVEYGVWRRTDKNVDSLIQSKQNVGAELGNGAWVGGYNKGSKLKEGTPKGSTTWIPENGSEGSKTDSITSYGVTVPFVGKSKTGQPASWSVGNGFKEETQKQTGGPGGEWITGQGSKTWKSGSNGWNTGYGSETWVAGNNGWNGNGKTERFENNGWSNSNGLVTTGNKNVKVQGNTKQDSQSENTAVKSPEGVTTNTENKISAWGTGYGTKIWKGDEWNSNVVWNTGIGSGSWNSENGTGSFIFPVDDELTANWVDEYGIEDTKINSKPSWLNGGFSQPDIKPVRDSKEPKLYGSIQSGSGTESGKAGKNNISRGNGIVKSIQKTSGGVSVGKINRWQNRYAYNLSRDTKSPKRRDEEESWGNEKTVSGVIWQNESSKVGDNRKWKFPNEFGAVDYSSNVRRGENRQKPNAGNGGWNNNGKGTPAVGVWKSGGGPPPTQNVDWKTNGGGSSQNSEWKTSYSGGSGPVNRVVKTNGGIRPVGGEWKTNAGIVRGGWKSADRTSKGWKTNGGSNGGSKASNTNVGSESVPGGKVGVDGGPQNDGWKIGGQSGPQSGGWKIGGQSGPQSNGWKVDDKSGPQSGGWKVGGPQNSGWKVGGQSGPQKNGWKVGSQSGPQNSGWKVDDQSGPQNNGWKVGGQSGPQSGVWKVGGESSTQHGGWGVGGKNGPETGSWKPGSESGPQNGGWKIGGESGSQTGRWKVGSENGPQTGDWKIGGESYPQNNGGWKTGGGGNFITGNGGWSNTEGIPTKPAGNGKNIWPPKSNNYKTGKKSWKPPTETNTWMPQEEKTDCKENGDDKRWKVPGDGNIIDIITDTPTPDTTGNSWDGDSDDTGIVPPPHIIIITKIPNYPTISIEKEDTNENDEDTSSIPSKFPMKNNGIKTATGLWKGSKGENTKPVDIGGNMNGWPVNYKGSNGPWMIKNGKRPSSLKGSNIGRPKWIKGDISTGWQLNNKGSGGIKPNNYGWKKSSSGLKPWSTPKPSLFGGWKPSRYSKPKTWRDTWKKWLTGR